jgi:hypothetical protein
MFNMTRTVVSVVALGWLCVTALLRAQTPLFEPGAPIDVGTGSGQLALVDTNDDGHLDLVISHVLEHVIEVRLGNGRGQFAPRPGGPVSVGVDPGSTALGDVNADRRVDLVAAHKDRVSEYIQIFPGDGRGTFGAGIGHYTTSPAFEFYKPVVRLANVDRNGTVDIISSNGRRNTIEILLGDGRGAFKAAPTVLLTPGSDFYTFGVGDIDVDGHLDLVTTVDPAGGASGRLEVRRGIGDGRFRDPSDVITVLAGPRVAAVEDLNADSRPDVVVNHVDSGRLSILLNSGRGSFVPAAESPHDLGFQTYGVAITDVNRDGRPDIVATTVNSRVRPYNSKVVVLLGSSHAAAPGSPFDVGPGAFQLAVGDVNEDRKLDVVTSSFEGGSIAVLMGR